MNQQEKTRITRERILTAAIAEFGTNSYDRSAWQMLPSVPSGYSW